MSRASHSKYETWHRILSLGTDPSSKRQPPISPVNPGTENLNKSLQEEKKPW